jgi:hypothetical protein
MMHSLGARHDLNEPGKIILLIFWMSVLNVLHEMKHSLGARNDLISKTFFVNTLNVNLKCSSWNDFNEPYKNICEDSLKESNHNLLQAVAMCFICQIWVITFEKVAFWLADANSIQTESSKFN